MYQTLMQHDTGLKPQRHDAQEGPGDLSTAFPPLTPIVAPWVHKVLADQHGLAAQFKIYGSPLNIHAMPPFRENHTRYARVIEAHGLRHLVFFARKANKCSAFVEEAKNKGFGVDTASYRELEECLRLGCPPQTLVLTAAIKERRLVELAVRYGVPIMLDNLDECRLVDAVARAEGCNALVGIRVSGFQVNGETLYSRFGFPIDEVPAFVRDHLGPGNTFPNLVYRGLHFHLNGYSRTQRGEALLATIHCADALRNHGINTAFIDIGGGFLINYLTDKAEWDTFHEALREAVLGRRLPITFNNNGLGLQLINGALHGEPTVYPYYNETPDTVFLESVLQHRNRDGDTAAALLRERNIQFRMEPGRSMLNQTGITLARVAFRKRDSRGDLLVGLDMNRTQLFSSSADFLLDPIFIPRNSDLPAEERGPCPVYFVGAYCLEQDIILKRKIVVPQMPQVGDWVCFVNTAGYMMHFFESEAHLFELATNLIADVNDPAGILYVKD